MGLLRSSGQEGAGTCMKGHWVGSISGEVGWLDPSRLMPEAAPSAEYLATQFGRGHMLPWSESD
jgi:hypothetical protein